MIINDYIEPTVLTGFVREVPTPFNLLLNQFLPDRFVPGIEAAIDQVTKTNRAAKFRSWDTETPIGQRDTFQRSKVKLPPLGIKTPIGEEEALMLEVVRTGGDNRDAYVQAIYDDAANNAAAVYNRMELARGDVLVDGKFTLTGENGLTIEADFGLPIDNQATAPTVWSDIANASPLTNVKTWIDTYVDINGERPGKILTSNTVINNLLLSQEMRELFYRGDQLTGGPNLLTPTQLNQVFQAYGWPEIQEYNTRIQVDGTNVRVIEDNFFLMLPADRDSLGHTAWGVTAEALYLAQNGGTPSLDYSELPGLVGVTLREGDPLRVWTKVGAVGMPLLTDPRRLFVADVL